jgi:outer membrane protein
MRGKLLILIVFFLYGNGIAQERLSLSVEEAREYALEFNRTVQNAELSVQQSQEQLREAIAAGLPQVNATTDYSNALGAEISIQFEEGLAPTKIPIKPSSNFNLQVGQLIFNANYFLGIQSAKLYRNLSERNQEKTERDIASQVIQSYYLVLVSGESLKILKNNAKNLEEIYRKTKPMVDVGMMEKVELDQLSVQLNSLNNSVKSAERQLEMSLNMLRLQLGVSADTELELTDSLSGLLDDKNMEYTLGSTFDLAGNVDYRLLKVQEQMNEKQVTMQKANYLPTLSGFYSYTYKLLKPAFDMSAPHMLGLQLNIPIFSSGERLSKLKQAKLSLETTRNNKAFLEDQLSIQFKQLQFNLRSAMESYETQKMNIEVSRNVYNSLKSKYEQGVISSLELTTADNNYLNAESDYLSAIFELLNAQNELNTLLGNINN